MPEKKIKNKIYCPDAMLPTEQRIQLLFESISKWMYSEELMHLLNLYGRTFEKTDNLKNDIETLSALVEMWDYRSRTRSGERWEVQNDSIGLSNKGKILELMEGLGLRKNYAPPIKCPDYILPVGGKSYSNFARVKLASKVAKSYPNDYVHVVALSGERAIDKAEHLRMYKHARNAKTEFEVISDGLEKFFDLNKYIEEKHLHTNQNESWTHRKYITSDPDSCIESLSAPSSNPLRRANSFDTFEFFLKKYNVKKGDKILIVTTSLYVPYQLLSFMPLALEYDLYVDCIGVCPSTVNLDSFNPSNYLQEVKATVDAIKRLSDKYL